MSDGTRATAAGQPTAEDIGRMPLAELRRRLAEQGQITKGRKAELVRRLVTALFGPIEYEPGRTRCKRCGADLRVQRTLILLDCDPPLVERCVRCRGKRQHTYKLFNRATDSQVAAARARGNGRR